MEPYHLKLYVAGRSPRSERAIANLHRICTDALGDDYQLEIVDVLEQPQQAERDRILVTPTLIRQTPPPPRRVLGDLSDASRVLWGLDLQPSGPTGSSGPPALQPSLQPGVGPGMGPGVQPGAQP